MFATPVLHCHSVHGCCVPALCVLSICRDNACNHVMPDLVIPRPWKTKAFTAASILSVLCVCVDGPCCSPVFWLCSEVSLPTGKAVGVANTPDSLGTNQTDTRSGFYLPACPGVVLCTSTCARPTYFSLASAAGTPPPVTTVHGHCSDNSDFIILCRELQR